MVAVVGKLSVAVWRSCCRFLNLSLFFRPPCLHPFLSSLSRLSCVSVCEQAQSCLLSRFPLPDNLSLLSLSLFLSHSRSLWLLPSTFSPPSLARSLSVVTPFPFSCQKHTPQ